MNKVKIFKVSPKYVKEDILQVIQLDKLPIPYNIKIKDRSIVQMLPGAVGGNHIHPRIELFIGFGEVSFYYKDGNKIKTLEFGSSLNDIKLLFVPSMMPHAVKNTGHNWAILYELADMKQIDVERYEVLKN
jgi:hypothetical protein